MVGCALLVLGTLFVALVAWLNGDEGLVDTLQVGTRAAREPASPCPAAVDERLEGVARMARDYSLTVRESDIFALMARRYASAEITETLVWA